MNIKNLSILIWSLVSSFAVAQSSWIEIGSTKDTRWEVKPQSGEQSNTKGGIPIYIVVGRVVSDKSAQINLYKWYVSLEDCSNEMGKVVSLSVEGKFLFENDFVFGSGTVASSMARSICYAANADSDAKNKKGTY